MCESFSDLGLLLQKHYLRDFIDIITVYAFLFILMQFTHEIGPQDFVLS